MGYNSEISIINYVSKYIGYTFYSEKDVPIKNKAK